jgi:hypothetical protein
MLVAKNLITVSKVEAISEKLVEEDIAQGYNEADTVRAAFDQFLKFVKA